MSEAEIQKSILQYLESCPSVLKSQRINSGMAKGFRVKMANEGTPDIIGVMKNGKHLAIEVKTKSSWNSKGHGATDKQIEYVSEVYGAGGIAGIVCSVDQVRLVLAGDKVGF